MIFILSLSNGSSSEASGVEVFFTYSDIFKFLGQQSGEK